MSALIVLQRMLMLFFMMLVGYVCYKIRWLDDNAYGKLSKIVVNIMNPLLIINGVLNKDMDGAQDKILMNILLMLLYFVILIVLSFPVAKILKTEKSEGYLYRLMMIFSNVGFMGIPVITGLYGESCTIYIAFYILGYNLLLYTYGIFLVSKSVQAENKEHSRGSSVQWKKILNSGVIACLISIMIFAGNITVGDAVVSFVSYMGNSAVPLSMILIGVSIAQQKERGIWGDVKMYVFLVMRLVLLPVFITLIVRNLEIDKQLMGVFCLMFAMPVGSIVVLLATDQNADDKLCTKGSVLSTLFSVITIPLVAFFLPPL